MMGERRAREQLSGDLKGGEQARASEGVGL